MTTEKETLSEYFNMLVDWKKFPAYRMEPRVDSMIGLFLPVILKNNLGVNIAATIPEFPIRLGSVRPEVEHTSYSSKSYKVDFYCLTDAGDNLFIEFKTDSSSRRENQDDYLKKSTDVGFETLMDGVIKIYNVTTYKSKYLHLIERLISIGLVERNGKQFSSSVANRKIGIVYIQPKTTEVKFGEKIIDFYSVANTLRMIEPQNEFTSFVAELFNAWISD